MYDKILREMRARVQSGNIVITVHCRQEMFNDGLLSADVERCILTGEIVERQWDDEFAEYKYVIEGETTEQDEFLHVVAKLGPRNTVVITVYRVI
jgi:Domain of unknown function (DUF4258)